MSCWLEINRTRNIFLLFPRKLNGWTAKRIWRVKLNWKFQSIIEICSSLIWHQLHFRVKERESKKRRWITRLENFSPSSFSYDNHRQWRHSGVLALIYDGVLPILWLLLLLRHNTRMGKELQSSLRFQGAIRQELSKKKIRFAVKMLVFLYD